MRLLGPWAECGQKLQVRLVKAISALRVLTGRWVQRTCL